MTDDERTWQPPTSPPSPGATAPADRPAQDPARPAEPPRYGEYAPPAAPPPPPAAPQQPYGQQHYGQQPYGQQYGQPYAQQPYYQQPAGAPPAGPEQRTWAPAPKPGLIPLRPISFGALLGTPFLVLRRNPKSTFGAGLLVQGLATLLSSIVLGLVFFAVFSRIGMADSADIDTIGAGAVGMIIVSALLTVVVSVVAAGLLQGIIVLEVASGTIGEKLSIAGLFRRARGRLLALVGWALLTSAASIVGVTLVVLLALPLFFVDGALGAAIAVAVLLALGSVVAFAWLATKLSLVPSAIAIERLGIGAAIARSWRLTNKAFWRTLGAQLLVSMMLSIASQVVLTPVSLLSGVGAGLLAPTGSDELAIGTIIAAYGIQLIVTVVFGAVTAVVQSATTALIYLDLRMRREGLDLELTRFVEQRAAGVDAVDPYTARPQAPRAV